MPNQTIPFIFKTNKIICKTGKEWRKTSVFAFILAHYTSMVYGLMAALQVSSLVGITKIFGKHILIYSYAINMSAFQLTNVYSSIQDTTET